MKNSTFILPPKIPVDYLGVIERCKRFQSRSIKSEAKARALPLILSMIDLTTLEGADTPDKVKRICYKAQHLHDSIPGLPATAAVCVYSSLVGIARKALGDSGVKIAAVATGFPAGQVSFDAKIIDTKHALDQGADEIDMVISRGKFLSGEYNYVYDEIAKIKEICGDKQLKVIFETGEIGELENVRLASDIAIAAGADFIKTSTGKISPAATLPVSYTMLQAIRSHYLKTGVKIGMKPAGGISNTKVALQYLVMVKETLGQDWLNNKLFRFGASSLANDVLMQLEKMDTGRYSAQHNFAID
jgi:deoxyribose-phosphate aldolase